MQRDAGTNGTTLDRTSEVAAHSLATTSSTDAVYTELAMELLVAYRTTLREAPARVPAAELPLVVATVAASVKRAQAALNTRGHEAAKRIIGEFSADLDDEDRLGALLGWAGTEASGRVQSSTHAVIAGNVTVAAMKAKILGIGGAGLAGGCGVGAVLGNVAYDSGRHGQPAVVFHLLYALTASAGAKELYGSRADAIGEAWQGPVAARNHLDAALSPTERRVFATLGVSPPPRIAMSVVHASSFALQLMASIAIFVAAIIVVLGLVGGLASQFSPTPTTTP